MTDKPTPNWQPLSRLPLFATMIDEAVAEAQAMLGNVQVGVQTPHVLDDHTVDRILNAYTETLEFIALYRAQLERWQDEAAVPRRRPRSSGCWASSRGWRRRPGRSSRRPGPSAPARSTGSWRWMMRRWVWRGCRGRAFRAGHDGERRQR